MSRKLRILIYLIIVLNINITGQVNVEVPDSFQKYDEKIKIPVYVSELSEFNIKSYTFKLSYDPEILKAKGIKDSETLSDRKGWDVNKDIRSGSITVIAKGKIPLEGSGVIIRIEFEVIGREGYSPLTFDYFEFNNGSPYAELKNGEFWVLNEKNIEFKKRGDGSGQFRINNSIYNFPVVINLIKGKNYEIHAIPDDRSEFGKWIGNIESYSNPAVFYVDADQIIECEFELKRFDVNIVLDPPEAGSVSGNGKYLIDENVTIKAIPNHGWSFAGWYKDEILLSNNLTYSLTVNSNILIEADFERLIYILNVVTNPLDAGTVSGGGYYPYEHTAELTAKATGGWEFINWTVNEAEYSKNSTIQFKINDNSTVTANFDRSSFKLSLSANPPIGGITTGGGYYFQNQIATIEAKPNNGWKFDYWSMADSIYSYDSSMVINVNDEISLVANFSLLTSSDEINKEEITWYLSDPYPNPFNPSARINYSVPNRSNVSLKVYDILGNEVFTLVDKEQSKGKYIVEFNPSAYGLELASGMYFYRLQVYPAESGIYLANGGASNFVTTKKMILLK